MNITDCLPQKGVKSFIAFLLMLGAIACAFAGFTVLPVIGFLVAIPFAVVSIFFYRLHLNDQCQIAPSELDRESESS